MRPLPWRRRRRERDEDLRVELESFQEQIAAEEAARGLSEPDARRLAALRFGGQTQVAEQVRDQWRGARRRTWWIDVRHATRAVWRRPGPLAPAVITLALTLGATAAVLSLAWGMWLRPLPYPDADRLALVSEGFTDGTDMQISARTVNEWIARLRTVERVAAFRPVDLTVRGAGEPRVISVCLVTSDFFRVLGQPRALASASFSDSSAIVVSDAFAATLSPGVMAGTLPISIGNRSYTVVGTVPDEHQFPDTTMMAWLPADLTRADDTSGYYRLIARLSPSTTIAQATDDAARVMREIGGSNRNHPVVTPLDEAVRGQVRPVVRAAIVAAVLLLLVACANVASLFVAQAISRRGEYATQLALGAPARRIFRRILFELLWVSACGALLGIAVAALALRAFRQSARGVLPGLAGAGLDAPVIAAIVVIAFLVAVTCASIPFVSVLRDQRAIGPSLVRFPAAARAQAGLLIGQIAVSVSLVFAAGLLTRTVMMLLQSDTGIDASDAVAARLVFADVPIVKADEHAAAVQDILSRVRALPAVSTAGIGTLLPPRTPPMTIGIRYVGQGRNEFRFFKLGSGTPGYLTALGARFTRGRDFTEQDGSSVTGVAVISESAARHLFGDADPIGRQINRLPPLAGTPQPLVVGVVADVKYDGLDEPVAGAVYVPWSRLAMGTTYLVVRTGREPAALAGAIREAVREADPAVAIPEVLTLDDAMWQSTAARRLRAVPVLAIAVLAVFVTFVGLFGASRRLAIERRRELAIRSAVGASPRQIARLLSTTALVVVGIGVAIGCGLALAVGQTFASLLYGVQPTDLPMLVFASAAIAAGGCLAFYFPARRASRVEPVVDLR